MPQDIELQLAKALEVHAGPKAQHDRFSRLGGAESRHQGLHRGAGRVRAQQVTLAWLQIADSRSNRVHPLGEVLGHP